MSDTATAQGVMEQAISELSTERLVMDFELTTGKMDALKGTSDSVSYHLLATVRGFYLTELERRDEVRCEAWLDSDQDSPREFFLPA